MEMILTWVTQWVFGDYWWVINSIRSYYLWLQYEKIRGETPFKSNQSSRILITTMTKCGNFQPVPVDFHLCRMVDVLVAIWRLTINCICSGKWWHSGVEDLHSVWRTSDQHLFNPKFCFHWEQHCSRQRKMPVWSNLIYSVENRFNFRHIS